MREIKYRAWDNFKNRFVDNKQILKVCFARDKNIPNLVIYTDKVINCHIELKEKDKVYSTEFELMQYTGLKDKNGKEIYEGDIIVDKIGPQIKMVIKWDDECAGFRAIGKYNGENYVGYVGHINKLEKNTCEVIGNIYENKELLGNENNGR